MAILSVEMEPLLNEQFDLLPDAAGDLEEGGEAGALDELPVYPRPPRATTLRPATGAEDAYQSYLRDIRGFGLLTSEEEIDLARRQSPLLGCRRTER